MAASYNVFLIGRPPIREVVVQPPITLARFVDAVAVKYNLTADALDGIRFRLVKEEPKPSTAATLFQSDASVEVDDTASLPIPSAETMVYIVGQLAQGPAGGAAGGAAASIIVSGGSASPDVIRHCVESVFAVLDESGRPVCCGFFISPTRALTIYHDSEPSVGDTMEGQRFDPVNGAHRGERLHLVTERVNASLDSVLLRLVDGQPPAERFLTIPAPRDAVSLLGQRVAVVGLGIPTAAHAGEEPGELFAGLSWQHADIVRVGMRHLAYGGAFGPGDSGSALILVGHEVVGMHLAGWNYAPQPLPSVAEEEDERPAGATAAAGGGPTADLKRRRADDRAVAVVGKSATPSVVDSFARLAETINVGGWAVSLVSAAFGAFLA